MTADLKNKLRPSIEAFIPELERIYYVDHNAPKHSNFGTLELPFKNIQDCYDSIDQRISHQIKCVKLAHLLAMQDNQIMKQIIFNKFKLT